MPINIIEGNYEGKGIKVGIVAGRFNDRITNTLVEGAIDMLVRHNVDSSDITVCKVPGAFEIPFMCKELAKSGKYDAVIALGAVIRGSTPHFDYVSSEVTKGVAHVGLDYGVPVIFGVLTTDTIEQAVERAGTKAGNKGSEAAMTAIEMINLKKQVSK